MNMTYVFLGLGVVLLLLPRAQAVQTNDHQQGATCSVRSWDEDYSYLYYINRKGVLTYDSEFCRGCIENEADKLQRQGFTVTEVVLGTKYSGDL